MILDNFEKQIDTKIIDRGYEYFLANAVDDLTENPAGTWTAIVMGSEDYSVSVSLVGKEITGWECDCPYEYGPICKHVVAVLYALADEYGEPQEAEVVENTSPAKSIKSKKNDSTTQKAKSSSNIDSILKKLSNDELRNFVKTQLSKNREFRNAFNTFFADKQEGDALPKYLKLVRNIANNALGRHGFIDYANARKLVAPLMELCAKAQQLLERDNITESLAISRAIIEKIPEIAMAMDDSDGGAGMLFEEAFENLDNIVLKAPPLLKDELFNYCITEYPKKKYHDFGFEDRFLDILPSLVSTGDQEEQFFRLIDKHVEMEKKEDHSEYLIVQLLMSKISYLEKKDRSGEALAIIKENADLHDFRYMLIDKALKQKKYNEAKKLCEEGIEIAEKKRYPGIVNQFREKLLQIAELEKNITEILHWAEVLFYGNQHSMEYYRKLKKSWPTDDWTIKCEEIINKIKSPQGQGNYSDANALANVFIEEGYLERLLLLLQINSQHLNFIDKYSKHLTNQFPMEIVRLYEKGIIAFAEGTGRGIYNDVVSFLKKLNKIQGGAMVVNKLVALFREKYRNRRAMMEILDKQFK